MQSKGGGLELSLLFWVVGATSVCCVIPVFFFFSDSPIPASGGDSASNLSDGVLCVCGFCCWYCSNKPFSLCRHYSAPLLTGG
jgi:hypothetical protein